LKYRDRPLSGRHTLRQMNGKDGVETRIIVTSAIIEALDVQKKRSKKFIIALVHREIYIIYCVHRGQR